jgi:hypothetical protein
MNRNRHLREAPLSRSRQVWLMSVVIVPMAACYPAIVDRVGFDRTNQTFTGATGKPQKRRAIESGNPDVAVTFLLNWLEAQPVLASVKAAWVIG